MGEVAKCEAVKAIVVGSDEDATEESDSLPEGTGATIGGLCQGQQVQTTDSKEGHTRASALDSIQHVGWSNAWGTCSALAYLGTCRQTALHLGVRRRWSRLRRYVLSLRHGRPFCKGASVDTREAAVQRATYPVP